MTHPDHPCAQRRGERSEGGGATIEFIWLALILMVPLVYIVVSVFEVQRTSFGATAASRSAARAFVLAPDPVVAHHRAEAAARVTLEDHGVEGAQVEIVCRPGCHEPGSTVTVRISVRQSLPLAPSVLGEGLAGIDIEASHREPFGRYRSAP